MTIDLASREAAILDRLKDRYEQQGYQFFAHPGPELIPAFLGGFRPDAIALKPGDRLIIEVKLKQPPVNAEKHLAEIARKVAMQSGWRFTVLVEDESPEGGVRVRRSTAAEIGRQLAEVAALAQAGHARAAFILAWAVLEAAARASCPTLTDRPLTPMQTIQELAMQGVIEEAAADRLRDMLAARNAVAHGDFSVAVEPAAVRFLIDLIAGLHPALGDAPSPADNAPRANLPGHG